MNICVFGAASNAIAARYLEQVEAFAAELARRGHGLVFGGGATGLMGAAARGAAKAGGYILGVAPSFFNVEGVLYQNCTEFIYTETMRERKQTMEDRSDAVVMVPGGIGTFEEFFEMLTLKQLGRNNKPIAVFNVGGYFDEMEAMLQKSAREGFMSEGTLALYRCFSDGTALLDYLEQYREEHPEADAVSLNHIRGSR